MQLLQLEQSKLPLFHTDPKKDQFTGDQWMESFENSWAASTWNAKLTKSYCYNALRDGALSGYRMLSVVKINTNDFQAVRTAFLQNFGVQTNNRVVITDYTSMKQRKDESVQQFFTRIGDISYNYNLKNAEIKGDIWAAPEHIHGAASQSLSCN